MLRYWPAGLLLLFAGVASAAALRDPETHFFNQTLGDFREELQIARDEGKQGLLLFFEMDDCPFCARMKRDVLNRPEVQDYYRAHFRIIPVDIEGDVEITDFQGRELPEKDFAFQINRVRATPVFLFYDLEGGQVARYTGATSGIDEFLWLGEYVVNRVYKDMPFTRYKRLKRSQAAQ
ncbi:MAG: thioredoxin family protein [Thiogranum sp.]|nr:thioredoxin family protein [Thiogranum sp.]